MQNNWCDAVLSQINYYDHNYAGEMLSTPSEVLLKFKSIVLSEVLNEYAINKTRSIKKILETIESFDIDAYKKEDARCMINSLCKSLNKKWDSLFFGKALMQYTGADSFFRRAEYAIKSMPIVGKEQTEEQRNSIDHLFNFLNTELDKMLEITEQQKRTIIQYMLYVKAYDHCKVDYDWIYRTRYVR